MNKCKDCRWWGVDFEGVCDFPNTIHAGQSDVSFEIEAKANDDQGLEAVLKTGPEFGCLHFSPGEVQLMIEVLHAYLDGKRIKSKPADQETGWEWDKFPNWNWHKYDYRISEE